MHPLVEIAKSAVENYVISGAEIAAPLNIGKEFTNKKAGVFVTIEKKGRLRACIGTYLPCYENIAEETICNAVAAASKDFRFGPVKKEELSDLDFTVYVLNKPEPVRFIEELNPKKYGVIVKSFKGEKSGLLLPDLEGVETIESQIAIAADKAEIDLAREKIELYKFTVEKYQ